MKSNGNESADPASEPAKNKKRFSLRRLLPNFGRQQAPQSGAELIEMLRAAKQNNLIDAIAERIMEGAMAVSQRQARDIMLPRPKMQALSIEQPFSEQLELIVKTGHSRYPVIGKSGDEIKGILLTKDLLAQMCREDFKAMESIEPLLRPATLVPEIMPVNTLLEDFRETRNHMAIVIDEYGAVAGLVTIEDVLEEIVGEIEDEHDPSGPRLIYRVDERKFVVRALAPIDLFNQSCATDLDSSEVETVGGLVLQHFGHLPQTSERATIGDIEFKVLRADGRQIHLLEATLPAPSQADGDPAQQQP